MNFLYRGGLIVVVAILLTACMDRGRVADPLERPGSSSDLVRQQLLIEVDGEPEPLNANLVLSDEQLLLRALNTQFPSFKGDDLEQVIGRIDASFEGETPPDLPEFQGLGGIFNIAFLRAARLTLGSSFSRTKRVHLFVHGQIIDYEFLEQRDRSGNLLGMGSGRIGDIVYFTTVVTPETPRDYSGENRVRTDAVLLRVEVPKEDGFTVVEREYSDPSDPFPNTLPFTRAMLSDIDLYGYQYKLWSRGDSIVVRQIATKDHGQPAFTDLPMSDPRYTVGPDSCIDMLFQAHPPRDLAGLGPPFYCLGRCDHPGLVNTNAE